MVEMWVQLSTEPSFCGGIRVLKHRDLFDFHHEIMQASCARQF